MKKIEAIILDWAGTAVDYGSFAPVETFLKAFSKFDMTPTIAEVREPMGMLKRDHIVAMMKMPRITDEWIRVHGKMWTEDDVNAIYKESEDVIFNILKDYSKPKPFVVEAVAELRKRNIKIGSTTGYTDDMMNVVVPAAKEHGYSPDTWFTPNSVNNLGRPYPFMIFKNLEALKVSSVNSVLKIGDTVADIKEGKNAGLTTIGVVEGSSVMGLLESEFNNLNDSQKQAEKGRVVKVYEKYGADYIINNMSELCPLIDKIENN